MDKATILREIKRTAEAHDGVPLGFQRFEAATGIRKADWFGIYWARWGDAVREAGFPPNRLQEAYDKEELLERYAKLTLEMGRLPVKGDLRLRTRSDPEFPHETTFWARFGTKSGLVAELISYCEKREGYEEVARLCNGYTPRAEDLSDHAEAGEVAVGYVYLVKHGSRREYKIGRTNNPLRREGEIRIDLPEKVQPIHVIKTDDPAGVEAYWHRRFAGTRKEGEWFALTVQDIRAFKRWRRIY
ncbi:MAG TPA: GIY-YIG nuclease family protein [Gemmataceae bacterium]|nr:GIY-YIG nuclease family protein [Gemmataceae bacterium]